MAGSFAALRAAQGSAVEALQQKMLKDKSKGRGATLDDETFLDISHVRGNDGVGSMILRFLPAPDGEPDQYVSWTEFQFQGPGGWYMNRSRNDLKQPDPVYAYNGKLFADKSLSDDERKKRLLGRREFTVANVLVVRDPNKPANEGQVFKWKFGNQVFNMIEAMLFPDKKLYPDKEPVNIFDPIDGANFVLRVTTKKIGTKDVPSYEKSSFEAPAPLFANLEDFEPIYQRIHPLQYLIAASNYQPYEDLVSRFNTVMGIGGSFLDTDEPLQAAEPRQAAKPQTKAKEAPKTTIAEDLNDEVPWQTAAEPAQTATKAATATEFTTGSEDEWYKSLTS